MATFYNQATLSYNGNTTTSNITAGELVEILTAAKTAVTDTYQSGGRITYIISIVTQVRIIFLLLRLPTISEHMPTTPRH
mgnify:CR=1 FL=1